MYQTTFSVQIFIEDVNELQSALHITDRDAPNNFPDDYPTVDENLPAGTVVGTVKAVDQDAVSGLTFSLVDNANGQFRLGDKVTCLTFSTQIGGKKVEVTKYCKKNLCIVGC